MIRIKNIQIPYLQAADEAAALASIKLTLKRKYRIFEDDIVKMTIQRKAVDARKKDAILFVYTVDIETPKEPYVLARQEKDISLTQQLVYPTMLHGTTPLTTRPIIIGFGPSGMFAALLLAQQGYKPLVIERGDDVDKRTQAINALNQKGILSTQSNVLFGEGGAGTYSDGKLTTLTSDVRQQYILETLVKFGANKEILYESKPHVGTDVLAVVTKNIRQEIIRLGGKIRFGAQVTDILIENQTVVGLEINHQEKIMANAVLLGIGHSARDTFNTLYDRGITMIQKPFSVGVRIEHPQALINAIQYGPHASMHILGAADYKLSYHAKNGRTAYTFCMCPGGDVMCSASEEGMIATNGMSEFARDHRNANAGLLVNINPSDFPSDHPLAGIEFQRELERKAFVLGGSNYHAPIQKVGDFLADRLSTELGIVKPTYLPGVTFAKMTDLFPSFITDTLKEALRDFDKKMKGFAFEDALLTGVETRSSSPIRIVRNETHESNIHGLFPMGEGSGYAGGIMTSSVDGLKTAELVMARYQVQ